MAKSVDKKMLRVSLDKVFKKEDYIRTLLRQKDSIKLKEYFDGVTEYSFNKRISTFTLFKQINSDMTLFTLWGLKVEEFLAKIFKQKAINQKIAADIVTEELFKHLFRPDLIIIFNSYLCASCWGCR